MIEEVILEGVNDPAIFKVIFLAGGPGSGKSFMAKKAGLKAMGFVTINSDDAFEHMMRKNNLNFKMPESEKEQRDAVRDAAKSTTKNKEELALKGRLGLVIDGTGRDFDKIVALKKKMGEIGYDSGMVFVNTDLDTALKRNAARERSVPEDMAKKLWGDVQNNIGKFQQEFGGNFHILDNSSGADFEAQTTTVFKNLTKWSKEKPKNAIAKKWIDDQTTKVPVLKDKSPETDQSQQQQPKDTSTQTAPAKPAAVSSATPQSPATQTPQSANNGEKEYRMKITPKDDPTNFKMTTIRGQKSEEDALRFVRSKGYVPREVNGRAIAKRIGENYISFNQFLDEDLDQPSTEYLSESEYQGKTVELNKPFRTPGGPKKFAVYVKNDSGKVVIVRFGDPNMEIKRDDPERRASFRARHDCANAKDKTTPRYWSCYQWRASSKVAEEMEKDPCWKDYEMVGTKKKNGKTVPNCVPKEESMETNKTEIEEAKSDYELYHKDFSTAVQHAIAVAKKRGYDVDKDDWDSKVAMGPRKPSSGKTNTYSIQLLKGDKVQRKHLQMQVYNKGGGAKPYELNMYIESREPYVSIPMYVQEAAYAGNIGMMELVKFYQRTTDSDKKKLQELIRKGMAKEAWKLVQDKTGTKLVGKEFATEGRFDKYITKGTPTTPGMKKVSNPAGRTGNHDEWEVTGKTSTDKRTFKSKKEAQGWLDLIMKEDADQIDELSNTKLHNYTTAAKKSFDQAKASGDSHTMYKRGKGLMQSAVKKINNTVKSMKKEEVQNALEEMFSQAQIQRLKAEYSKINTIDPSSPTYKKLVDMLNKQDQETLKKLAGAGIKFVSGLARNRIKKESVDHVKEEADRCPVCGQEPCECPGGDNHMSESDAAWAKSEAERRERAARARLTKNDANKLDKLRALMAKQKKPVKEEVDEEVAANSVAAAGVDMNPTGMPKAKWDKRSKFHIDHLFRRADGTKYGTKSK